MLLLVLTNMFLAPLVRGHGALTSPPSWVDGWGYWGTKPKQQCSAGYDITFQGDSNKVGYNCMWYSSNVTIPGSQTLDDEMRTFTKLDNDPDMEWWVGRNPWMSPGSAPVFGPCGAAGGFPKGCPWGAPSAPADDCSKEAGAMGGFSYGPLATEYDFKNVVSTTWKKGSVVTVGWGIYANHGGGYQYRLCKIPPGGKKDLTEECFQQNWMKFHGNTQWTQEGDDVSTKKVFQAKRTTSGTFPAGSQWTRNPVPNCAGKHGGYYERDPTKCPYGLQFPAPAAGLFGQGENAWFEPVMNFPWTLYDQVEVPAGLETGDYVLSLRWDCEQTPQVFNSCADIKIVN